MTIPHRFCSTKLAVIMVHGFVMKCCGRMERYRDPPPLLARKGVSLVYPGLRTALRRVKEMRVMRRERVSGGRLTRTIVGVVRLFLLLNYGLQVRKVL